MGLFIGISNCVKRGSLEALEALEREGNHGLEAGGARHGGVEMGEDGDCRSIGDSADGVGVHRGLFGVSDNGSVVDE